MSNASNCEEKWEEEKNRRMSGKGDKWMPEWIYKWINNGMNERIIEWTVKCEYMNDCCAKLRYERMNELLNLQQRRFSPHHEQTSGSGIRTGNCVKSTFFFGLGNYKYYSITLFCVRNDIVCNYYQKKYVFPPTYKGNSRNEMDII